MRRLWREVRGFWEHDPGLSAILALLVVIVFVLPSFGSPRGGRGTLFGIAISVLLFAGVAGLKMSRSVRGLLLAVAVAAIVVRWWPSSGESAISMASLASVGLMATVVLAQTFRAGPVNIHRVQGAIAAYLLLGVAWAFAYELVHVSTEGAFAFAHSVSPERRGWLYFSFVTLTTLGYGDVTPVHPAAQSLAMMEALTGQLYPAILLARLVSLQTQTVKPKG